jgi:microsomal dipeptidase-like Zn-dependent dipeptidase
MTSTGTTRRYYPRPLWAWPRGIEWLHRCKGISTALQARGFSVDEAAGVMDANFLRVLTRIWGS